MAHPRGDSRLQVENKLTPTPKQLEEFLDPGSLGPIHMINLLKFRQRALYQDGRASDLTGEEAFNIYSRKVNEFVRASGGEVTFISKIVRLEIGEAEQLWDRVILASYPSRKIMLDIMSSDRMREISIHRTAGLEGQLNIETKNGTGPFSLF